MEYTSINNSIEISCLSCLIIKPKLFEETYLAEEHFYNSNNKLIYKLILSCYIKYKLIDLTLIISDHEKILSSKINWLTEYWIQITNAEASAYSFNSYQEKLIVNFKKEKMLKEIEKFKNKDITEQNLLDILNEIQSQNFNNKTNFFTADYIYNAITRDDQQINLRFEILNKTLQLSEHDFLVIGSRPGCGKTGFAINLLEDLSKKYNCVYLNMEMSEQQVLRRLVSINSKIPIRFLNAPESPYQNTKIKEATEQIAKRKIQVITSSQTMAMIKNIIIKEQKESHTIIFVDYIGLIHSKTKGQSSYERVTEIAKELRSLSMTYDCTIICVAQINRSGDNKPPLLSELKDSGELEQSAVNVILLHNDNYYKKVDKKTEELQCIVAKNRNGRTGIVNVEYDQFNQRIEELKRNWQS